MSRRTAKSPAQTHQVSPVWLIKAFGLVLLAAALCTYLALCLLFRHGQWQLVLHPSHSNSGPPGTPEIVRFGPDDSGTPQLVGIWLPAASGARYSKTTILFLPGGDGSRTNFDPTIQSLHNLGLNVLAFDYRGYGFSANTHPNEQRMIEDAEAAWRYLTSTRTIAPNRIIPYGAGVGASLAARLVQNHPETPALIINSPYTDLLNVVQSDPRTTLLPVSLLFHERFPLTEPLATLQKPKLLLAQTNKAPLAFQIAAPPKITVELETVPGREFEEAVTRFLDEYLSSTPPPIPSKAPSGTNTP
jgi:pimeloyl-ACP methyl ester carboxylesterase